MEAVKNIGKYSIVKDKDLYEIKYKDDFVRTPGNNIVRTRYLVLAERLLNDLNEQGEESYFFPDSILGYHYSMIDNFSKMTKDKVLDIIKSLNWERDWTLRSCPAANPYVTMDWMNLFGIREERIGKIKEWMQKCSIMQLTAMICIYNTFMSFNIAYLMAIVVEHVPEENHEKAIGDISNFYCHFDPNFSKEDFLNIFECFDLYYGIHFKEQGKHLPD